MPILPETHEVLLYDVRGCCGEVSELDLAYEVQVGQAATAGNFGGYSANMQDVGQKELKSMEQALSRKVEVAGHLPEHKAFFEYSKRLVRDLEGKGIIRAPHGIVDTVCCLNIHRFELESGIANATHPRGGAGNGSANINTIFNKVTF